MPIYVMHCLDCGFTDEYLFLTHDISKWKCSRCRGNKYEKIPARSSFRLHNEKTTGFTNTSSKTPSAG